MGRFWSAIFLSFALTAGAQELDLDSLADAARQWAEENLDTNALQTLATGDRETVQKYLAKLQEEFQGEYVLDLAALKTGAEAVIPLLEQYEETQPYALWLKTRLDYFDISEELNRGVKPPKPGERPITPTPAREREVWVKRMSTRPWPRQAQPYISPIKEAFRKENVPPELVWIAEVESSFNPTARSPAGAAGLFQLMPATAKERGLRTWPFDQRLRTEPAARAAAQQLAMLYRTFGDWRLALAAYNAGPGKVQSLLKRKRATTFDAIATALPAETQLYVPKVEATILRREGVKLVSLPAPGA